MTTTLRRCFVSMTGKTSIPAAMMIASLKQQLQQQQHQLLMPAGYLQSRRSIDPLIERVIDESDARVLCLICDSQRRRK